MRNSVTPEWRTRPRRLFDPGLFDGDENAIVDFKYSQRSAAHLVVRSSPERFPDAPRTPSIFAAIPAAASCTTRLTNPARPLSAPWLASAGAFARPIWTTWSSGPLIIDGAQYPDARDRGGAGCSGHETDAGDRSGQRLGYRTQGDRLDAAPAARGDHRRSRRCRRFTSRSISAIWRSRTSSKAGLRSRTEWCSSTSPATTWRATTSSSRITCFRTRSTPYR